MQIERCKVKTLSTRRERLMQQGERGNCVKVNILLGTNEKLKVGIGKGARREKQRCSVERKPSDLCTRIILLHNV